MGKANQTSTPYDDVFRTLLNDCSHLIIPVINEVFGENYSGKEEILFFPNEHFQNRQGGTESEKITDTCFTIQGKEPKKYHWECQSTPDHSMLVRFFEYDTQIALDDGEIKGEILTVTFPNSAVLYLRSHAATPDRLKIKMITPGGTVMYEIAVMKSRDYKIEEIFSKNLLFLIPFYIFTHEEKFGEYEQNEEKRNKLLKEYEEICNRLETLSEKGRINEYTKCTILDMSGKVLEHIAKKYGAVKKGVGSIMGGKILEYEAKTIKEEGREEGREEGIHKMVSTLKELDIPMQIILQKIQEKFNLSPEASQKYL